MIRVFDSIAALRREAQRTNAFAYTGDDDGSFEWFSGESPADTERKSLVGDMSLVPQAQVLMDSLDQQIETGKRVWDRSPAGAFVAIPDALAGLPAPMRRLRLQGDEHAPISVFVASTCSSGINANTLMKRGTTILALVMALARVRPVSLWTVALTGGERGDGVETVLSARINTDPLDLATACYCLTSAGFARRINNGIAKKINGFHGGWPRRFSYHNPAPYYDYLTQKLSPDPSRTLFIGAAQLGDELLAQPLVWIRKQIDRFTAQQEELVL